LIEQKRYSAAIAYLRTAPPDDTLQLNLATAYARNHNNDEALQILSQLAGKQPSSSLVHLNLGIVYTQQDRYREAAEQFREVLRLDPNDDVARLSLVKALAILAEFPSALPLIQEYARRNPGDFGSAVPYWSHTTRPWRLHGGRSHSQASCCAEPDDYDSRYNLGFVLAKLGKSAEARKQLEIALKLEARFQ